jgi:protoporphyrinogen oxidase
VNDSRSQAGTEIVILGAGPAGLGAALRLARRGGFRVTVLERNGTVGGNAGSFSLEGQAVDFGSHRLHPACPPEVLADIRRMLGDDLLARPRHGRIRLRGRWVHFPLRPLDLARHLPPEFMLGVAGDALRKRSRAAGEETFATVLERGLGRTICRDFYFPYAQKIWGVAPEAIDAVQARRRVSAGSLGKMFRKVLNAVPGFKPSGAGMFYYPRHGYGEISEAYGRAAQQAGVTLKLCANVSGVNGGTLPAVRASYGTGMAVQWRARQVLSTIPLPVLARLVVPQAPRAVLEAACALKYRAMILIYLVLETDRFTEYDAHYFPGTEIPITRLSEPKNYGLNGPADRTVLCAELPCSAQDAVWKASDEQLGKLVLSALADAGIPVRCPVRSVAVKRLQQAYPIYTRDYGQHFDRIDQWLEDVPGILTLGRQGLFVHDNTHHTLAMGYAAADCIRDDGSLDRERWAGYRRSFESNVVED